MLLAIRPARFLYILLSAFFLPGLANASVVINEIAWMGTTESYLCNWIELHNHGEQAVDIVDWTLKIQDTVRELSQGEGQGSVIPADGYLLLKRTTDTCPDPVPEKPGWTFTMGNLPNSGATLVLRRADESVVDSVVGGDDWTNVGGDNETKQTAQRTAAGWVTADPTPGAPNATEDTTQAEKSATGSTSATDTSVPQVRSARAPTPQSLTVPDDELALDIVGPAYGYVNQPLTLTASTSGVGDTIAASLRYEWNWGDTHNSDSGAVAAHTYKHPGTYVVTVSATYARHKQVARHQLTVLPTPLSIEQVDDRVYLHNDAAYEIDVSGVTIAGASELTMPDRSFITADSTITIDATAVGLNEESRLLTVHDRSGELLASNHVTVRERVADAATTTREMETTAREESVVAPAQSVTTAATEVPNEQFRFASEEPSPNVSTGHEADQVEPSATGTEPSNPPTTATTQARTTDTPTDGAWWSWLILLGLLAVAAGTLLYPRHRDSEV